MNETTIEQGFRLLRAGCPDVKLRYQNEHKIVPEAIQLGRLWDLAHKLYRPEFEGPAWDFPTELSSGELIEALVCALEKFYNEKYNGGK